ncbi:MAG: DUF3306 domain-containing protein [Alphaproteobacteria bacterium]|nr:DUF3306 domain-containing protein [Alphaproteobacteria bacterium]
MAGDDSALGRWSRRKQAARRGAAAPKLREGDAAKPAEAAEPPDTPVAGRPSGTVEAPRRETSIAGSEDAPTPPAEVKPKDLPDIESLDYDSDFTPFLKAGVPEQLQRLALRRLWRSNPIFGHVDGLVDYGEDYSSIGVAIEKLKSAYQVGRGYLTDEEAEEQRKLSESVGQKAADEDEAPAEAETEDQADAEIAAAEPDDRKSEQAATPKDRAQPEDASDEDTGDGEDDLA